MARNGAYPSDNILSSSTYPDSRHAQPNAIYSATVSSPTNLSDSDKMRYRDPSTAQQPRSDSAHRHKPRQPINDAVNSALTDAGGNDPLPPDVVNQLTSQITANVLQHLKASNLDSGMSSHSSTDPTLVRVPTNGDLPTSSLHSPTSPPLPNGRVYTPPSPNRPVEKPFHDLPPSPIKPVPTTSGRYTPDEDRPPASRNSRASPAHEKASDHMERPKPAPRMSTEVTTLEKIWGPLFDEGRPTPRLGQFLRGLALHLIEDYEPQYSLVITPAKMRRFYQDTKLNTEFYPWQAVFDDRTASISRLYRDLEAQHHLIQERHHDRPDIPGLTPVGFERWSTLMLLAHPDQEFERLQKAVLDMPICNYDDRKERFPKEISRRLFPTGVDTNTRGKLRKAIVTRCSISLPEQWPSDPESSGHLSHRSARKHRADSTTSATSSHSAVPPSASRTRSVERERERERDRLQQQQQQQQQQATAASSEDAIEEEDEMATPQPIERERKPYFTQPGGGRNFDSIHRSSTPPGTRVACPPPTTVPSSSSKLGRSASVASNSTRSNEYPRPQPHQATAPPFPRPGPNQSAVEAPSMPDASSAPHPRSNSMLNHQQTSGRPVRRRSPSTNTKPGDYHHYASSPSNDAPDDPRRFRDYERNYPPPNDRHENHRSSMYEVPPRDRDARPRYQPSTGYNDPNRNHYSSDEDYYRSAGGRPQNGYDAQQYYR